MTAPSPLRQGQPVLSSAGVSYTDVMKARTVARYLCRTAGLLFLYTWLVTYDVRAWMIVPSIAHYIRFPVDPALGATLDAPQDPAALVAWSMQRLPEAFDFAVYGVPWYFPTPREALEAGRGDCEARAVMLASLLAARHIPYHFEASFSHLWVAYPGRPQALGETDAEAMMARVGGKYRFRWPSLPRLRHNLLNQKALLWTPLHPVRKILLLVGWPGLLLGWPRRRKDSLDE